MSPYAQNPVFAPPLGNHLLASATADCLERLQPHLELVELNRGETIHDVTGPVRHVDLPVTALISAFVDTANGASVEVALVGNDGALGLMALLCGTRVPFRAVVDTSGCVYRVPLDVLEEEVSRCTPLRKSMMRHLTARMIRTASNAACNGHHSVLQRLCRALLMRLEYAADHRLFFTHEMMAQVLGVHRPAVTEAASHLRNVGAIAYMRGRIEVLDQGRLVDCACECYFGVKQQVAALLTP